MNSGYSTDLIFSPLLRMAKPLVYPAAAILILITLTSCGGRPRESAPDLRLRIEPVPGVYVQYDSRTSIFRLGNELVERRISVNLERQLISTTSFINKLSGNGYIRSLGKEFSFRANGMEFSGVTGNFGYVDHEIYGAGGMRGLALNLRAMSEEIGLIDLRLIYEVYAHMPVIRKWMEIRNSGGSSITIDSLQVESLSLMPGSQYDLEVYTNHTDGMKALSPVVFDTHLIEGFVAGNEAPGVLKWFDLYSDSGSISIGLPPHSQSYAAEIQLAPGEEFATPPTFILLFRGQPESAESDLAEFIAQHIAWGTQHLSVWYENIPAGITEPEIRQRMQLAAESGANIFCLTSWMDKRGDWNINENIPFEKLSQHSHDLGMKLGLSMEIAVADEDSQILSEYPQWAVTSENSSYEAVNGGKMMCLGSEYTLYAAQQINSLVKELDIGYIKLTGPMIPDGETGGCFAKDHIHRSSGESLWYIYEGLFAVCKHLHSQNPDLIVDVETKYYTPEGTPDYALLKYADMELPF